jgi:hypothetical protein
MGQIETTVTARRASGRTGATCREPGPYYSGRNARVIVFFRTGQPFPVDADGKATTWTLVRDGLAVRDGQVSDSR